MPTLLETEVIIERKVVNQHLTIFQIPSRLGFDFELRDIDHMLLNFEDLNLFGVRWVLLHRGSNLLKFANFNEPAKFTMQYEDQTTRSFVPDKGGPIIIPPPTTR